MTVSQHAGRASGQATANSILRPDATLWHSATPKSVSKHCLPGGNGDGFGAWAKHLDQRRRPGALAELFPGRTSAVLWGAEGLLEKELAEAIGSLTSGDRKTKAATTSAELLMSVVEQHGREVRPEPGLAAIAMAHALPALSKRIDAGLWWSLLERLIATARDAAALKVDHERAALETWAVQLLGGELPWTLAEVFPELVPCRALGEGARKTLCAGAVELLDGEGMPRSQHLVVLRPLLGCWTRCALLSTGKRGCFHEDAMTQYEWLVRQAMRLARADGSQLLQPRDQAPWSPDLFAAALDLGGDYEDEAAAAEALPGKLGDDEDLPPQAATNSEWSGVAVLRPDWRRNGPRLAVAYNEPDVRLELETAGQSVLEGIWEFDVEIGGRPAKPEGEWEETCWFSDDDVDFLELTIDLSGGARLERQLIFAREDLFLILNDVIIGGGRPKVTYAGRLPLAAGVEPRTVPETREIALAGEKPLALVLPLALGEWKVEGHLGELRLQDEQLALDQQGEGRHLCCPLFLDLKPRRMKKECTWRQLTVAEELKKVPSDVAVAFRVQVGRAQWVIYRSLDKPGNRTLLGLNLSSEFYLGRFDTTGEAEELIEIEP